MMVLNVVFVRQNFCIFTWRLFCSAWTWRGKWWLGSDQNILWRGSRQKHSPRITVFIFIFIHETLWKICQLRSFLSTQQYLTNYRRVLFMKALKKFANILDDFDMFYASNFNIFCGFMLYCWLFLIWMGCTSLRKTSLSRHIVLAQRRAPPLACQNKE